MMLNRHTSFEAQRRYEEEQAWQVHNTPRLSFGTGDDMTSHDHSITLGQECYSTLSSTLPYHTFTLDALCSSVASEQQAFPASEQPYASIQPQNFTDGFTSNLYAPRKRSVMDTKLQMLSTDLDAQIAQSNQDYLFCTSYPDMREDIDASGTTPLPVLLPRMSQANSSIFTTSQEMYYPSPTPQNKIPMFGSLDYEQSPKSVSDGLSDEEESVYDKPYAQLIYEALLAAPGHRMLLREIYEWFIRNTRKPKESGTNGWQNSIRHNLSMNQAFENDKSDPATSRGARKANSVWVLTDHAIKHGVQSTTRYRKIGTPKKGSSNRIPAIQRQKSGARGGRAARRAAHLKRQGEEQRRARNVASMSQSPVVLNNDKSRLSTPFEDWSIYSQSPATPAEDLTISSCYSLLPRSYYHYDHDAIKFLPESHLEDDGTLRQILGQNTSEIVLEDIARLQKSEEA